MTLPIERFLDTNVLLRYFTRDDERKAERARALLTRVLDGQERVETSTIIIFETVYGLQRLYHVPKGTIRDMLVAVLNLRGLHLPEKAQCIRALNLFVEKNVSFANAYNAVYLTARNQEIYSWDTDFDRIDGVVRLEP